MVACRGQLPWLPSRAFQPEQTQGKKWSLGFSGREGPVIPTACHVFLLVPLQPGSENEEWLKHRKHSSSRWRSKLFGLVRLTRRKAVEEEEEEEEKKVEEEKEESEIEWVSTSPPSEAEPEQWEPDTEVGTLGSQGKGEIGAQRWV